MTEKQLDFFSTRAEKDALNLGEDALMQRKMRDSTQIPLNGIIPTYFQ